MPKLAIICSHPIQYYAPLFKYLSKEVELIVFYCHNPNAEEIGKDGFGKKFQWDIDLLSGYEYEFLENRSKKPSLSKFNGCDTPQIGEKLRDYGATHVVIFGWYLKSFIQALKYCNRNNIIVAARGDSQLDPKLPKWKKILKRTYYPYFLKKYDAFLYVGKRNKQYLNYYGVPDSKLIFSPHAVDQEFWSMDPSLKEDYKFIFIWSGKFISIKRPLDVVQAFEKVFYNQPKVELWMVGAGELYDEITSAANSNNVRFLGFQNQTELKKIYNQSDCLILSSESETWGLVVNEAMSCGLPAIVSNACGCSEDMILEGKTGYIYSIEQIDELKQKMQLAVKKKKEEYSTFLKRINEIYSYKRNRFSFQEFLDLSKK